MYIIDKKNCKSVGAGVDWGGIAMTAASTLAGSVASFAAGNALGMGAVASAAVGGALGLGIGIGYATTQRDSTSYPVNSWTSNANVTWNSWPPKN